MSTFLTFHDYRYFPYERALARREAQTLFGSDKLMESDSGLAVYGARGHQADRLTYFAKVSNGRGDYETTQFRLEDAVSGGKRQATRYSVHGLHEYKGKFNPQIAKALLNICGAERGSRILDPFCGSGTTLVEACHIGAVGLGYDINPFAVFLANAKLTALRVPADELRRTMSDTIAAAESTTGEVPQTGARYEYLGRWFSADVLREIEEARRAIDTVGGLAAPVLKAIASNLLRDYSLQEPADLRIRRRKSPLPDEPFLKAFATATSCFADRLAASQTILGNSIGTGEAKLHDTTSSPEFTDARFDLAVTSPPYAMALPYVDTQRLSLVWLGLCNPEDIGPLDERLVGSREVRLKRRRELDAALSTNACEMPQSEIDVCLRIRDKLGASDGFRRIAVPSLLYRYFEAMQASFRTVFQTVRSGGMYALVVGHNHTTIGGSRIDVDTPNHLASLAMASGWTLEELVPLQTYQRWGLHSANAVASETLLLLRKPLTKAD